MKCKSTQYMRPNGRKQEHEFELPDNCQEGCDAMLAAGCRFEAEELMSGTVSITIANNVEDTDIELVHPMADEDVLQKWERIQNAHITLLSRKAWEKYRIRCDQCEAMMIQNVFTHEHGCPNAKRVWSEDYGLWLE